MKRLYRNKSNQMLAGVCSGIADYLDVDTTIIRLIFVLFTFLGGGGLWIYIVLWIIMPERPAASDVIIDAGEAPAAKQEKLLEEKTPVKAAEKKTPAKKPAQENSVSVKKPAAKPSAITQAKKPIEKKPADQDVSEDLATGTSQE
jgi:phage shock protein PspC (stress-responsive transcriptional regulator)